MHHRSAGHQCCLRHRLVLEPREELAMTYIAPDCVVLPGNVPTDTLRSDRAQMCRRNVAAGST